MNQNSRLRRLTKTRIKIKSLSYTRLCVHRTNKHIYAQIIDNQSRILASASTLELSVKSKITFGGNILAAKIIGKLIANRALQEGIKSVAYDRSGFKYHGRIAAVANAARQIGLNF